MLDAFAAMLMFIFVSLLTPLVFPLLIFGGFGALFGRQPQWFES